MKVCDIFKQITCIKAGMTLKINDVSYVLAVTDSYRQHELKVLNPINGFNCGFGSVRDPSNITEEEMKRILSKVSYQKAKVITPVGEMHLSSVYAPLPKFQMGMIIEHGEYGKFVLVRDSAPKRKLIKFYGIMDGTYFGMTEVEDFDNITEAEARSMFRYNDGWEEDEVLQ